MSEFIGRVLNPFVAQFCGGYEQCAGNLAMWTIGVLLMAGVMGSVMWWAGREARAEERTKEKPPAVVHVGHGILVGVTVLFLVFYGVGVMAGWGH